jgi:2,5-diamino-6-hydroxy-4-(5-phosphoribosylamino)pyrimidine 1'-reductase
VEPLKPAADRPYVMVNMASSVDGKITSAAREVPAMTTPYDRMCMDRIRAQADAILVGAESIRADRPKLHVRSKEMQEYRRSLGKTGGLLKIVVTKSGNLAPDNRSFMDPDGGGVIIATVEEAPADKLAALESVAEIWKVGTNEVDLTRLLSLLYARGIRTLLVEGGGELNWGFIVDDLVDELYLTIAPTLLGGRDAPTMLEGAGLPMASQRKLHLVDVHREGDELYCTYKVVR